MSGVEGLDVRNKALIRLVKQVGGKFGEARRETGILLRDFADYCEYASVTAGEAHSVANRILWKFAGGEDVENMTDELNECIEYLTAVEGYVEDAVAMGERLRGGKGRTLKRKQLPGGVEG